VATLENLKDASAEAGGWFGKARRFLVDVRAELGRVTWPSWREVRATTIVVILTSVLFGVYLYLIDASLSALMLWLFRRFGG
jgi:preprotein translocase subunit SecE